jgi:hypothetical protein
VVSGLALVGGAYRPEEERMVVGIGRRAKKVEEAIVVAAPRAARRT